MNTNFVAKKSNPMQHIDHIKALEKRLKTSTNLGQVFEYFLDHLGDHESFLDACEPLDGEHDLITAMVNGLAKRIFPKEDNPRMEAPVLMQFPETDFIHGLLFVNKRDANILFFEESKMGLLITSLSQGNVDYFRFAGIPVNQMGDAPHYDDILRSHGGTLGKS